MKEQTQVNRPILFLATAAVVLGTLPIHADARTVAINELGARLDRTADRFSSGALAVFTNPAAPATIGRPAVEPLLQICESDGVIADGGCMKDDSIDDCSPTPPAPASSPPSPDATDTPAEDSPEPQTQANDEESTDESDESDDSTDEIEAFDNEDEDEGE